MMEQINEILRQIEIDHHTSKNEIEYVIVKPAERLLKPNAMRTDIPNYNSTVKEIQDIYKHAYSILEDFANIGKSDEIDTVVKYQIIREQLQTIDTLIVPGIKDIASFYKKLLDKPVFNIDSRAGLKAYNLVRESVEEYESLCERLIRNNAAHIIQPNEAKEVELVGLVSKIFNSLDADVNIHTIFYSIMVSVDERRFTKDVLLNIYQNIERYAFPRDKYDNVALLQKKVKISFEKTDDGWSIEIANNGEPFTGDVSKIFECGYHHGGNLGNGYGMHTAKQFMKSIGGDISMQSSPDEEYKIKFTIKLLTI